MCLAVDDLVGDLLEGGVLEDLRGQREGVLQVLLGLVAEALVGLDDLLQRVLALLSELKHIPLSYRGLYVKRVVVQVVCSGDYQLTRCY